MKQISNKEAKIIVRLLGELQNELESAIDSELIPGTNEPRPSDKNAVRIVRECRRSWAQAETLIKKLEDVQAARERG